MQKINRKEKLSQAQLKRFNKYEEAAKDCLADNLIIDGASTYHNLILGIFSSMGWKPGMKGFTAKIFDKLDFEIVDVKQTSEGTTIILRPVNASVAVCMTTAKVRDMLQRDVYRNFSEKKKLIERDAFTFEHLSENAMKTFYPEAHKMRTRDLKKFET